MGFFDKVKSFAASTSLGKSLAVKPKVKEYLATGDTEIQKLAKDLESINSLKGTELEKSLHKLIEKAKAIVKQISSDEHIDPIVEVIGNHLGDFKSVKDMEKQLPQKKSVIAMKAFGNTLVDVKNYQRLYDLLLDTQNFAGLVLEKQESLLKNLGDNQLIEKIQEENAKLNVDKAKARSKELITDLCTELKCTPAEKKPIIKLFDKLMTDHLSALNTIRQEILTLLPAFLAAEKERLLKQHPELVIKLEEPKTGKAITPMRKQAAKPAKVTKEIAVKTEKVVPIKEAKKAKKAAPVKMIKMTPAKMEALAKSTAPKKKCRQ